MSKTKKYYWIKLPTTYFNDIAQKKMRKQEQGLLYQVIYLKLMLLSCNQDGFIYYQEVYDTLAEEIADAIGESETDVNNALDYFVKNKLLIFQDSDAVIPQAQKLVGSETDSAERMRNMRERNKVTKERNNVCSCYTELDKELDEELDEELDKELDGELDGEHEEEANNNRSNYGEFNNVPLSKTEYKELCNKYTKDIRDKYIEKMSRYIKGKNGKGYGDQTYIHLCDWIDKDYSTEQIEEMKEKEKTKKKLKELEERSQLIG